MGCVLGFCSNTPGAALIDIQAGSMPTHCILQCAGTSSTSTLHFPFMTPGSLLTALGCTYSSVHHPPNQHQLVVMFKLLSANSCTPLHACTTQTMHVHTQTLTTLNAAGHHTYKYIFDSNFDHHGAHPMLVHCFLYSHLVYRSQRAASQKHVTCPQGQGTNHAAAYCFPSL